MWSMCKRLVSRATVNMHMTITWIANSVMTEIGLCKIIAREQRLHQKNNKGRAEMLGLCCFLVQALLSCKDFA